MVSETAAAALARFLGRFSPEVAAQARAARAQMRALIPGAVELVYDNYNALVIGYGPTERASQAVCSLALYPRWVNLFFLSGVRLRDPGGLLKGSGTRVRHVVLDGEATLRSRAVRSLVRQAVALAPVPFGRTRQLVIRAVSAKQRPRRPPGQRPA